MTPLRTALKQKILIAGEQISITLENRTGMGEEKVKIPAVLATLLMNNGLVRQRFNKLSEKGKFRLIQKVKEAKEITQQLEISMKLLSKSV